MDKIEPIWECPSCHHQITNTMLQSAVMNFQCNGVFGKYPRASRCNWTIGDYKLKEEVNNEE